MPVLQLLDAIEQRGYTGGQTLLYRYSIHGRIESDWQRSLPSGSLVTYSPNLTSSQTTSGNGSTHLRLPGPS
ncbi:hypothetical protein [Haloechinothrix alba]|uniref:hypothetical protein n=1 Tax=Haloechinothrix alba TaxID=664784 RepID=UPI001130B710|nr:hypothetical protein [Haloechinothrix alba]